MLQLPRSNMSDSIVEKVAGRLSTVTFFDLSYCCKIGARAIEVIGKNCKMLAGLRRNMHPIVGKLSQNDEAHAIATTMPKLKHLEIAYLSIDTASVLQIIRSCRALESLDLRGCWEVRLEDIKDLVPTVKILGPYVVDHYARNDWESYSDYSDSFYDDESLDGVWDDEEERLGSLEMRFYDGLDVDVDSGYGWSSP